MWRFSWLRDLLAMVLRKDGVKHALAFWWRGRPHGWEDILNFIFYSELIPPSPVFILQALCWSGTSVRLLKKMMMLSIYYSNAILNGLAQHIWIKNPIKDAIFLCYLFAGCIHTAFLSLSEYNTVYLLRVMWFPALTLQSLNRLFTFLSWKFGIHA